MLRMCIFIFISCLFTFWHLCCVGSVCCAVQYRARQHTTTAGKLQFNHFHSDSLHIRCVLTVQSDTNTYTHPYALQLHRVYDNDCTANNQLSLSPILSVFQQSASTSNRILRVNLSYSVSLCRVVFISQNCLCTCMCCCYMFVSSFPFLLLMLALGVVVELSSHRF